MGEDSGCDLAISKLLRDLRIPKIKHSYADEAEKYLKQAQLMDGLLASHEKVRDLQSQDLSHVDVADFVAIHKPDASRILSNGIDDTCQSHNDILVFPTDKDCTDECSPAEQPFPSFTFKNKPR